MKGGAGPDFALEGNLLTPPLPPVRARVRVSGGRIRSVEPTSPIASSGPGAAASAAAGGPEGWTRPAGDEAVWALPSDCWILPGFSDGHTHLLGVGLAPLHPDLSSAGGRQEALEMLSEWLRTHPGDSPVIADGWDQSTWKDPGLPTRAELDAVASSRPVAMRRVCGHVAVLNSPALAALGSDWPGLDPVSGLALEKLPLSLPRLWAPSDEQCDEAVAIGTREAWKRGITSIHEMGHARSFRAFSRAARDGRLRLRVTQYFAADLLDGLEAVGLVPGFGDEFLRTGGLKLFLDGSIGGRSAAVRAPYVDASGGPGTQGDSRGLLLWEDETLARFLERAARGGWPVAMHAIGDRAILQAIETVERLCAAGVRPAGPGPRLEHAEMIDGALLERAVASGFFLSMQPNFSARWQNPGQLYEKALGRERARALNPYRSAAATGRLHFGSDTMPMDPFLGLAGAMDHPLEQERLGLEQAVWHYTGASAAAVLRPFGEGRVAEGEPADLIVIRLPREAASEATVRWQGALVLATWIGGTLLHADAAASGPLARS